jgi:hypothetical protein
VLKGDLEDAIFAANFGYVVAGIAPKVYQDPEEFFRNTHPAELLKKLVATIFQRLADPQDAGAAIRLSTGFGGGKTHTLIALWHLARNISRANLGTELLPAAGRPHKVAVAGIDAGEFGAQVCGTHGSLQTHSLWGELAYQLGGEEGYNRLKDIDNPASVPDKNTIRAMLPADPTLILLDEIVIYMAILHDRSQGQLLAFLNALIGEVGARKQAVLVITDPAGQAAYQKETEKLADVTRLQEADKRLSDVLGRSMSNYEAIGKETAQVILRRLFESVGKHAAEEVSAEYYNTYQRVLAEHPDVLPPEAATPDYAQRIVQCYPFHPRLLETAQWRLGAMQDFNQSRGTLRLFARILRDIWESASDIALITAGDLDWHSRRIQADLLERLKRDNFKAVVESDVIQHAGELDAQYSTDIHRRVAAALLLESLPFTAASALDRREVTLAVLRPSDVGHEPGEALDRLQRVCWHTYKTEGGVKVQFRYEPNAIKIIDERAQNTKLAEDARSGVLTLAQSYFRGHSFTLVAYPENPRAVADSAALKLVLSESERSAKAVCEYEDDTDPAARLPRRFRNAIFGIAPTPQLLSEAVQAMRQQLAAEQVAKEQKKNTPLRVQVDELLPTYQRNAQFLAIRAFNRVVFQGRDATTLAERYMVSAESPLAAPADGQTKLMDFLSDNQLIYKPNDVLDVDLLLDELLPGATPSLDHEGAYPASSVHERALASRRLKLLPGDAPLRQAILNAVKQGKLVVRLPGGETYDAEGCVRGGPGTRERVKGLSLTTLKLTAEVLLARPTAPCVADWLRVDEVPLPGETLSFEEVARLKGATEEQVIEAMQIDQLHVVQEDGEQRIIRDAALDSWQPVEPEEVTALTWEQALQHAANRPLVGLTFRARSLPAAEKLVACAQPFGAQALTLAVQVSGVLKDGGKVNFSVSGAHHNAALKPLDMARTMLRGTTDGTAFQAQLALDLGEAGQRDTASRFAQAQAQAPAGVELEARFGPAETFTPGDEHAS